MTLSRGAAAGSLLPFNVRLLAALVPALEVQTDARLEAAAERRVEGKYCEALNGLLALQRTTDEVCAARLCAGRRLLFLRV